MSFCRFWIWHKPWRTISPRCSWCRCRWLPWRGQRKVGSGRTVTSTPRASPTGPRSSPGAEGHLGRDGGTPTNHPCPLAAGRTVLPSIIFSAFFHRPPRHKWDIIRHHSSINTVYSLPYSHLQTSEDKITPDHLTLGSTGAQTWRTICYQSSIKFLFLTKFALWTLVESVGQSQRHQQMLKASVYTHRNYKLILMFWQYLVYFQQKF